MQYFIINALYLQLRKASGITHEEGGLLLFGRPPVTVNEPFLTCSRSM